MVFWHAITLRDALWHERQLSGKLAAIRVGAERAVHKDWGPSYSAFKTGPGVTLDAREDIDVQIEWLLQERPRYLLSHASNLRALAKRFIERGLAFDSLKEVRSYSEMLPSDLRDLVSDAWSVPVTDMYTANEVGYIALQCPASDCYHVQSDDVLVEVINESGSGAAAGMIGRVLMTSLHNFVMPLLRYELGDYAEVGEACSCSRTLPVLTRIMGRTRNMIRLPDGRTCWPGFPLKALTNIPAIRQFRMIQRTLTDIDGELVLQRDLSDIEKAELRRAIQVRLRYPFNVHLRRVSEINQNQKFEDFVCLLE